jgi:hypothetical protein
MGRARGGDLAPRFRIRWFAGGEGDRVDAGKRISERRQRPLDDLANPAGPPVIVQHDQSHRAQGDAPALDCNRPWRRALMARDSVSLCRPLGFGFQERFPHAHRPSHGRNGKLSLWQLSP